MSNHMSHRLLASDFGLLASARVGPLVSFSAQRQHLRHSWRESFGTAHPHLSIRGRANRTKCRNMPHKSLTKAGRVMYNFCTEFVQQNSSPAEYPPEDARAIASVHNTSSAQGAGRELARQWRRRPSMLFCHKAVKHEEDLRAEHQRGGSHRATMSTDASVMRNSINLLYHTL